MKILFLGANGQDASRLRIAREVQDIRTEIERAQAKHRVELRDALSVTPTDLQRHLLEAKADIVHFSGHGMLVPPTPPAADEPTREFELLPVLPVETFTENEPQSALLLEDEKGRSVPVPSSALAKVFSLLRSSSRCVVLNACFSSGLAEKIAQHVDCVIGMRRSIDDRAASKFAVVFYLAVIRGETLQDAFAHGCAAIDLNSLPDTDVPRFFVRRPELGLTRLMPPSEPHLPTPPPSAVTISDLQVIPSSEDEQERLDRAVMSRLENDPCPDSVRPFLRPFHRKIDAPWSRFTVDALRPYPSLLARYYPNYARPLLPGYDGFDFKVFAAKYREKIAHRCQDHRLLGLPPTQLHQDDLATRISLANLFVPLRFRPDKEGAQTTSLVELLNARKNVVVLGDPGMGKSTLLNFLALLFAKGTTLEGWKPALPKIVPMPISLRDFVHEQKSRFSSLSFVEYLAHRASTDYQLTSSHWAFFDATLRMGEAVVLFDGLDEVGGDAARMDIAGKIASFQDEYPHVQIWVTSRVYGYTKSIALPTSKFEHVRVLDLDDEQVGEFLERWYKVQFPDNPRERDTLRQSLRDAVFHTSRVRRLAGCPLLLTLMAFIHRVSRNLPQDRAALYDQCVEMLLRSWQEAKGRETELQAFEKLNLRVSTQKDYLAHLALFIQEKNEGVDSDDARGIIERDDALERLTKRHFDVAGRSRPHLRVDEAREEMAHFLHYIGDRTGLLLDRGGGKLSFIHLAFQEYLAAWLFTVDPSTYDNATFFKQHLGKQAWEEVLLLRLYVILRIQGGVGAFDVVTNAIFRELSRVDSAGGWLTLLRALRDNLDFTAPQQDAILKAAISKWLETPQLSGTWFAALKEVQLFSEKAAPALRSHLAQYQANANGLQAIACLHLEADLFGLTAEAAARFRARSDLPDLLPDLIAFITNEGIAALLSERATADDWAAALAAFDGREAYGMTLGWATGALDCPVKGDAPLLGATRWMQRKIAEEAASRAAFSVAHKLEESPSLFERFSSVRVGDVPHQVLTPLAGAFVPQSASWALSSATRPLFCPAAAAERVAETYGGTPPLEEALASSAEAWIEEWLCHFSIRSTRVPSFVSDYSRDFGGSFGRSFGRAFVHDFGRDFVWRFASRFEDLVKADFLRDFVAYFGRFFIRYFVRDFGRAFEAEYGATYGLDFVRSFVIDRRTGEVSKLGREFGRHFGELLRVNFEAPNALRQLESALADKHNVHTLLQGERFWDWLFFSVLPNVELSDEGTRFMHAARPDNPFAIPLLLANLFTAAALQHIFCLGRHFALSSLANEYIADEAFTEWLLRHPVDVHAVAWSWDVHAMAIEKNCGALAGARGALSIVHANYAALMTGINVDETSLAWKKLLQNRNLGMEEQPDDAVPTPKSTTRPTTNSGQDGPITQRSHELAAAAVIAPVLSWVHISDLHFGHPDERRRTRLSILSVSLRDEVCRHQELGLPRVDAIFVSGDIAWNGKREQYDEARTYLLEMAGAIGLSPERVFVVPGNHDVEREKSTKIQKKLITSLRDSEGGKIEDELVDAEFQAIFADRQTAYLDFAAAFGPFSKHTPPPPRESRLHFRHSFEASDGRRVRVLGMNTALLAGEKDDHGKLHLGLAPLREVLSGVDEEELVVLLSHHPFSGGWLADEREVEREARCRTHLHLSGHVHDAVSEDYRRGGGIGTVRISSGAMRTEAGMPPECGYNLACVLPERDGDGYRVRIYPRRWSNRNQDFRIDVESLPRGCHDPWVDHEIPRIGRRRTQS